MDLMRFDGRVALVTGAGSGLGLAHARLLAERGAHVVINDLGTSFAGVGADGGKAERAAAEIRDAGGSALADGHSVATVEGAAAMVATAIDAFGRLDIVVNNAGLFVRTPFPEPTVEELQRQLDVHVIGAFNVCRAAWPHMVDASYGRVVITSSASMYGEAGTASYSSAKSGAYGLSRALADAGRLHGITVNALMPSAFTPMAQVSRSAELEDPVETRTNALITPERVAPVVVALVHESCTTTGRAYIAGGGSVRRIFLAETRGYFAADPTPEDVASNWQQVEDEEGYSVPVDMRSHRADTRALLRHLHFGGEEDL